MSVYYVYLTLLLLIFILIYYGISYSSKFAPLKIRVLSLTAFVAISFRYIALIIFLITKNIKSLYLLKPLMFLNLLCIPVLAVIAIYILARIDKIKFNYCIIISIALLILYVLTIIKFPVNIETYGNLGYIMAFNNKNLQYGIYVIINTIFFFNAIIFLGNKNSNKLGMWMIAASAFIVIAELILRSCGISIFPAILLGDMLWIAAADYAIFKLKK